MFDLYLYTTNGGLLSGSIITVSIQSFPENGTSTTSYLTPVNSQYEFAEGSLLIIYIAANDVKISSYLDRSGVLTPLPIIAPSFKIKMTTEGQSISAATGNLYLSGA